MRRIAYLVVVATLLSAPAFAQGSFTDVPSDHWAYDAVDQLQKDGLLIGYPDGTFAGKRTITRYEFAVALARIVNWASGNMPKPETGGFATKEELKAATANMATKGDIPDVSKFATKSDVDAIKKLVDEFRDEIAALGVDVDALKRDVQALGARLEAVEAEQKRVRITGEVNVFAITGGQGKKTGDQLLVDLDNRNAHVLAGQSVEAFGRFVSVVKDFDLNIVGRVGDKTTANATINYGNYLNYLGTVDAYVGGARPTNRMGGIGEGGNLTDGFFPYYLYIDTALGKGALCVGRFPLQFTPYTMKMVDVDSYTTNLKTDDGNYPVDGVKLAYAFGGVDVALFAAKNDSNTYLANGLTSNPGGGLGSFHDTLVGGSVGGLPNVTQSAGARINVGTPWNGKLAATYYQAWSLNQWQAAANYDQARVYGADLNLPFLENYSLVGSWTRSDTLKRDRSVGVTDVNKNNAAWDAKINAGFGSLSVGAGYKRIERNFAAAGYWDKIGRWTNPTNIQGPYVDLSYPIMDNLKLMINGELQTVIDPTATTGNALATKDDKITKAEAGVKWGFTKCNAVDLSYQWVRFDPKAAGSNATETYLTLGVSHVMSPNANLKVGYQLLDYKGGTGNTFYGAAPYKGGLGVVQLGVSF